MATALAELGARRGLVVHSDDGLDELSVNAPTTVVEVREGEVVGEWRVDPGELGVTASDPETLRGGDATENLRRMRAILGGEEQSAAAEAVALNTAAALYVADLAPDLGRGLEIGREVLRSGAALELLEELARHSQEIAGRG
jgi:anthranilate phosphoribosyltransferase